MNSVAILGPVIRALAENAVNHAILSEKGGTESREWCHQDKDFTIGPCNVHPPTHWSYTEPSGPKNSKGRHLSEGPGLPGLQKTRCLQGLQSLFFKRRHLLREQEPYTLHIKTYTVNDVREWHCGSKLRTCFRWSSFKRWYLVLESWADNV